MGRIHRYKQTHEVRIINLVAGGTREGRVLKTLLEKLEKIRKELNSDKVFDVIGRLFEGVSLNDYLENAVTDEGAEKSEHEIEGKLTPVQVQALVERERKLYGEGGEVVARLDEQRAIVAREQLRRLLPGYVRSFIEKAAPLLGLRIEGDLDGVFSFAEARPRALDPFWPLLEEYPGEGRNRFTLHNPHSFSGTGFQPVIFFASGGAILRGRARDLGLSIFSGSTARCGFRRSCRHITLLFPSRANPNRTRGRPGLRCAPFRGADRISPRRPEAGRVRSDRGMPDRASAVAQGRTGRHSAIRPSLCRSR
jgi:hypothetical protein